jgi:hypothetical protein
MRGRVKFVGMFAQGSTRYEVLLDGRKVGEVYKQRFGGWVATDGVRTWSGSRRKDAAWFLLPKGVSL